MSKSWKFLVRQENDFSTSLVVGNEDDALHVNWQGELTAEAALAVLNNLTQALDLKLTGSCANERLMRAYRAIGAAH